MKIIAFMPIKLHNERCPGKNTRILGGKPLLAYELETLESTGLCGDINVFCSSEDVIPFIPEGVNFLKRPEFLDLPTSNFTQLAEEFIKMRDADVYILLHATAPFITANTMKECIEAVTSGEYDSAFCARKIQTFLWQNNRPLNFDASNLPRTQDLTPIYEETSGIYVFKKEVFTHLKRRIGEKPFIKVVSMKESVDIDEEKDFSIAESVLDIDF